VRGGQQIWVAALQEPEPEIGPLSDPNEVWGVGLGGVRMQCGKGYVA